MTIVYRFSEQHIEQLYQLYQDVGWGGERTLDGTRSCVENAQVCIGILDKEHKLIGFTRVLSDFTYKALIFDVIVASEHRGNGLAQQLIELVKHHDKLKNVRHFELYCLPEMMGFYSKLGFSSYVDSLNLMRLTNNNNNVS